jgi:hypothetical protein
MWDGRSLESSSQIKLILARQNNTFGSCVWRKMWTSKPKTLCHFIIASSRSTYYIDSLQQVASAFLHGERCVKTTVAVECCTLDSRCTRRIYTNAFLCLLSSAWFAYCPRMNRFRSAFQTMGEMRVEKIFLQKTPVFWTARVRKGKSAARIGWCLPFPYISWTKPKWDSPRSLIVVKRHRK